MKAKTKAQILKERRIERVEVQRVKLKYQDLASMLGHRQEEVDSLRRQGDQLREDNKVILRKNQVLMEQRASHPLRTVDPTAEVVMMMKRAMEHSINTSAALLDAMGELVDNVSGRKARRERDQELDLSHIEDPSR